MRIKSQRQGGLIGARKKISALVALVMMSVLLVPLSADAVDDQWTPPVSGRVVRAFQQPVTIYAAGHRGVDFAAQPGTPVRAANSGVVSFSGDVAGALHVVIAHGGGIRTSYSFLTASAVTEGQSIRRGQIVGTTGGTGGDHDGSVLHFGVRVGDRYVDPMLLFAPRDLTKMVRLVPISERDAADESDPAAEKRELTRISTDSADDCAGVVGDIARVIGVGDVVETACDTLELVVDAGLRALRSFGAAGEQLANEIVPAIRAVLQEMRDKGVGLAEAAQTIMGDLASVTTEIIEKIAAVGVSIYEKMTTCPQPASTANFSGSGNMVMAVAGLNSSRKRRADGSLGSSFAFAADALGYSPSDVNYFSYDSTNAAYSVSQTFEDLPSKAILLSEQLKAIGRANPGRAVDLVGHSQGGVVIDIFLTRIYRGHADEYPPLANVITFASPHEGTPLATVADAFDKSPAGIPTEAALSLYSKPSSVGKLSVAQLSEGSRVITELWRNGLPLGVRFLSIVGSEDPVVPSSSGDVPGAPKVIVPVGTPFIPDDHSAILNDDDAISAAQAQLAGGSPASSCGPLVDVGGELYSNMLRLGANQINQVGAPLTPLLAGS